MSFSWRDYGFQAYKILQIAFIVAPIVAGLDKFFNFLVNWEIYIAPFTLEVVQGHSTAFMYAVGVIEIVAGIGVLLKPRIFSYIVALWLLGIIINLLLQREFYDIALRDLGLMLSALALGRLSHRYDIRELS